MGHARFVEIGYIQRTHGIKGEVQLVLNSYLDEIPKTLESVFLDIEGIPTPFFVESIRQKTDDAIIVKFEDFDLLDAADDLVGLKVLLLVDGSLTPDEVELKDLVGYTVFNAENVRVGTITKYEDFGFNAIYEVQIPPNDADLASNVVLIPATDDIIVEFDEVERTVKMDLPEGLLNLGS